MEERQQGRSTAVPPRWSQSEAPGKAVGGDRLRTFLGRTVRRNVVWPCSLSSIPRRMRAAGKWNSSRGSAACIREKELMYVFVLGLSDDHENRVFKARNGVVFGLEPPFFVFIKKKKSSCVGSVWCAWEARSAAVSL